MTDKEWEEMEEALKAFNENVRKHTGICFVWAIVNPETEVVAQCVAGTNFIGITFAILGMLDSALQAATATQANIIKGSIIEVFKAHEKAPSARQC